MPRGADLVRLFRLAVRLIVAEGRQSPGAVGDIALQAARVLTGKTDIDRHQSSTAVRSAAAAAADTAGKRSRTGGLAVRFGLGLLRHGWVEDALWVLQRAHEWLPDDLQVEATKRVVAAERDVLTGRWRPEAIAGEVTPVPGRILHVVGKSLPHVQAGFTVRTQAIARSQLLAGLDPTVVTALGFPWSEGASPGSEVETLDEVPYRRLGDGAVPGLWTDRLMVSLELLSTLVEDLSPSVVHAHSDFQNAELALALRDRFGLPVVYEVRGFWEETWLSKESGRSARAERYRWRHQREIAAMSSADRVVTLSPVMRDRIVGDGVPAEKITIIPNAVDPDDFPVLERDEELAGQLGIDRDRVTVGYITSLVGYEGVDDLIAATEAVLTADVPVQCVIVGDGEDRAALESLAHGKFLGDNVIFAGRVRHDEVLRYYSLIDIFVVPRKPVRVSELVTPLKPFEALSTGRSLMVSDVAPLQAIADRSRAAVSFRAGDPADLGERLVELIGDPDKRRQLAERGAEWVRSEHTWTANAARYVEMYEGLGAL